MKLKISFPDYCRSEVRYITNTVFAVFLGLDYRLDFEAGETAITITVDNSCKSLVMPATFFCTAKDQWLGEASMPRQPLAVWDTCELPFSVNLLNPELPVIYGKPGMTIIDDVVCLGLDILGSAFFMLSRYEEIVRKDRDEHGRFLVKSSIAGQENFIDRPLITEYVEVLWSIIIYIWPFLKRKQRTFQTIVTADVDYPYDCASKSFASQCKQLGGDVIRRKKISLAFKNSANYLLSKFDCFAFDAYYPLFNWMMSVNEKFGNIITFYFIAANSAKPIDGCYSLDEKIVRKLIREIHARGHLIGLHGSYNSGFELSQLELEFANLKKVMNEEGIRQKLIGGRQHYLRWDMSITPGYLEKIGLDYDSTLTYAEHAGFRCGTCHSYNLYDLIERRELSIIEQPFVMMEKSIMTGSYQGLAGDQALEYMTSLKKVCKKFSGQFVILWHNSFFETKEHKEIYEEIVS